MIDYDFTDADLDPTPTHSEICEREIICYGCANRGCEDCMIRIDGELYCEKCSRCAATRDTLGNQCRNTALCFDEIYDEMRCEAHCSR